MSWTKTKPNQTKTEKHSLLNHRNTIWILKIFSKVASKCRKVTLNSELLRWFDESLLFFSKLTQLNTAAGSQLCSYGWVPTECCHPTSSNIDQCDVHDRMWTTFLNIMSTGFSRDMSKSHWNLASVRTNFCILVSCGKLRVNTYSARKPQNWKIIHFK